MYCSNCGKELLDDAKFCPACGTKQEVTEGVTKKPEEDKLPDNTASQSVTKENTVAQSVAKDNTANVKPTKDKSGKGTVAIILLAIAAVALVVGIVAVSIKLVKLEVSAVGDKAGIFSEAFDNDYTDDETDSDDVESENADSEDADSEDADSDDDEYEYVYDSGDDYEDTDDYLYSDEQSVTEESDELQPSAEDTIYFQCVFPYSSEMYLERTDIEGLSKDECLIARNEIYARHGRKFKNVNLVEHFSKMSWYIPEKDEIQQSELNDYEIKNVDLISEYEKEMGYR